MATLFRRSSRPLCQCQRQFSTSSIRPVSLQWDKNDPDALKEALPPYPYGPARWYKQSRLGLYGGQRIQFGNNVSEEFETKTRRSWQPNIFTRKLFSKALNRNVQVRVSARVLRTIDKLGGLDEYLLGEKEARLKQLGESGWWLRWAIMQTSTVKKRFAEERRQLGLPERAEEIEGSAESLTPVDEDGVSLLETDAVAMDDAFQIEQTEDLPPLKFRVGRGQHVVLTANGWRRTRPSQSYYADIQKEKLANKASSHYVEKQVEAFAKELEDRRQTARAHGEQTLTNDERDQVLKIVRRRLHRQLKVKVGELYEERLAAKAALKAERKEARQAKLKQGGQDETLAPLVMPAVAV